MQRAKHPCHKPGCKNLTSAKYCDAHAELQQRENQQHQRLIDERRDPLTRKQYNGHWARYSQQYRRHHPFCIECEREGILTASEVVDHIIPHRGDYALFWDVNNHQPLCERHHTAKTANEGGQWGRKRKAR